MSSALYTVRVYFDAGRGCVKVPGMYRQVTSVPAIPGLPKLTAIDYAPEVNVHDLQPYAEARREMTADELAAIRAWLDTQGPGET